MLGNDIEKTLVSNEEIKTIVKDLGARVTSDYHDRFPVVLGLLKGCIPFMSEFIQTLDFPIEIDFMDVSSYYGGIESSSDVKIEKDLSRSIKDRDILIAEDIVDSGRTLNVVIDLLMHRGARSVEVVTLLDKPEGRAVSYTPKYVGKTIPKLFVVGYGLDFQEKYRNLPYVGVLKASVYAGK